MARIDILVLDGETHFARKVVRSLGLSSRWRIHVLAKAASDADVGLAWSRHVRGFHVVEAGATDEHYLSAIERAVRRTGALVVLPVIEASVLFCIRHRAALLGFAGLAPLPGEEAFTSAIDKGRLAALLAKHGIPHPATRLADTADPGGGTFPVLIKPRRSSGGRGIRKVCSASRLEQHLAPGAAEQFCVQEYIEGTDAGCSVLAVNGRIAAWTTQRGLRRPGAFSAYSEVEMVACDVALEVATRLVQALNWSGIANIDFRLDASGRALVLEVNGRFWHTLLASTLAGVNFPELACRLALGERFHPPRQRSGRYVHPRTYVQDIFRRNPNWTSRAWTSLSMTLSDPLPELLSAFHRHWPVTLRRRAIAPGGPLLPSL